MKWMNDDTHTICKFFYLCLGGGMLGAETKDSIWHIFFNGKINQQDYYDNILIWIQFLLTASLFCIMKHTYFWNHKKTCKIYNPKCRRPAIRDQNIVLNIHEPAMGVSVYEIYVIEYLFIKYILFAVDLKNTAASISSRRAGDKYIYRPNFELN